MSDQPVVQNAFGRLLSEFREGQSLTELSEAMRQAVAAARDAGKAAELTYKVKFTPSGNAIVVTDEIKTKLPPTERDQAIFFPAEDNSLQRNNPSQREFNLKEVEKPAVTEIKTVTAVTA